MAKEDLAKLKEIKAEAERVTQMAAQAGGNVTKQLEATTFELKKARFLKRFESLSQGGRIEPWRYRELVKEKQDDIKRLAKLDQDTVNSIFNVFGTEKVKIDIGQRGSTNAVNFTELGKSMGDSAESELDRVARENVARLSGGKLKMSSSDSKDKVSFVPSRAEVQRVMSQASKHLSAVEPEKKEDEKKMAQDGQSDPSSDPGSDDATANMQQVLQAQQNQINEMTTYLNRLTGMVTDLAERLEGGSDDEQGEPVSDDTEEQSTSDMASDETTQDEKSDAQDEEPVKDETQKKVI